MNRFRWAVFGILVAGTFAAFFVAQKLKRTPPVVQGVTRIKFFSPNGDTTRDVARFSFKLKTADDVTVSIVDRDGGTVRVLRNDLSVGAYDRIRLVWDGREENGQIAPDGVYRIKLGLRKEGRSVVVPAGMTLDNARPEPVVVSIGPGEKPGPEILPGPESGARIRIAGPVKSAPQFMIYRTDLAKPKLVDKFSGTAGSNIGNWDGTVAGKPAPAGTYMVAVRVRDRAGNFGTGPRGLPPTIGEVKGKPGITVRYVAVQPPTSPVRAGKNAVFKVDATKNYRWSVRRLGESRPRKRGKSSSERLAIHAPRGESGIYLLSVSMGKRETSVPFAVRGNKKRQVLVVLPATTWQGLNRVDDDGRGFPTTLEDSQAVRQRRPYAGDGLPVGFMTEVAPLIKFFDAKHLRYDITSDLALAKNQGPMPADYSGVVLAGSAHWLSPATGRQLRRFVMKGGNVLALGTESLRRSARVTRRRLVDPSPLQAKDIFGSSIKPLAKNALDLLAFPEDSVDLFQDTEGLYSGFTEIEETTSLGAGIRQAAAGPQEDHPVLIAFKLGKGLVIRTGLPQWAIKLKTDRDVGTTTQRAWELISR